MDTLKKYLPNNIPDNLFTKNELIATNIPNTIKTIIANNPESVADYKNGHDRAIKFLMGQVMKETKGKANPKMAMDILTEELQ